MKKFILTCVNVLMLALCLSAQSGNTITVSGLVTTAGTGAPVTDWDVFVWGDNPADSTIFAFGTGLTDATGHYSIVLDAPGAIPLVHVWVASNCPNDPGAQWADVPVANGQAIANFSICPDMPPSPDCFVWANYVSTDVRTFEFTSFYDALDSTAAVSYLWNFGDGTTSTEANPTHTFAGTDSLYLVTLTVTGANGCIATTEIPVYIFDVPPFPDCWVLPNAIALDSLTYSFSAQVASLDSNAVALTYFWDFGDSTTSTAATPTHTYAQDGLYFVTVVVTTTAGCQAEITFPVGTGFPPFPDCQAYISYDQTDSLTFEFSAIGFGINGDSLQLGNYHWDFGDGTTSTDANPTHTYAQPGIYTVLLTALTDDSCEVHVCDVIFAIDCPIDTFWYGCQAMFEVTYDSLGTAGTPSDPLTLHFRDVSFGAVQTRIWDFGDGGTSTEANPSHTYAAEGLYTVTLSITTVDGCESSMSFIVYVGHNFPWTPEFDCQALFIPMPDSIGGNGIQFLDLSYATSPIQSWAWNFGDGTSSSEQYPYHVYAQPGIYQVTLRITADSCDSEISFNIDSEHPWNFNRNPAQLGVATPVTGTKDPVLVDHMRLLPNPVSTEGSLVFQSPNTFDYTLRISDMSGKTVWSQQNTAQNGLNTIRFNAANFAPGMYMAQVISAGKATTLKFVKQ